ncbi:MAG: GNAT family N-acetyltransferase [Halobacteriales archaeon]
MSEPNDASTIAERGDQPDPDLRRTPQLGRPMEPTLLDAVRTTLSTSGEAVRRAAERVRDRGDSLPELPLTATDEAGRRITYRPYEDGDVEPLVRMYDDFDPADRAQGTPPLGEQRVRSWLDEVLDGVHAVAVHDERVVGHVMLVPDGTGRHELAIFVHQSHQGAGIGTTLLRAGLGHARDAGIGYVWLSVGASERRLQKWYSRTGGFSTVNPMGMAHRMSRRL